MDSPSQRHGEKAACLVADVVAVRMLERGHPEALAREVEAVVREVSKLYLEEAYVTGGEAACRAFLHAVPMDLHDDLLREGR